MGTLIHEAAQDMLTKHKTIDEVMAVLNEKVKNYDGTK